MDRCYSTLCAVQAPLRSASYPSYCRTQRQATTPSNSAATIVMLQPPTLCLQLLQRMLAKPTTCQCSHPWPHFSIYLQEASIKYAVANLFHHTWSTDFAWSAWTTPLWPHPQSSHFTPQHWQHIHYKLEEEAQEEGRISQSVVEFNARMQTRDANLMQTKRQDRIGSSGSTVCGGGGVAVASLLALFPVCNINWQHAHCTRTGK